MPYIEQDGRNRIDPLVKSLFDALMTKGDMNYAMTCLLHLYIQREGKCHANLNDAVGIIASVKTEFERKVVAPYEDEKIEQNGDIIC